MSAYSGVFPRFISGWAGERGVSTIALQDKEKARQNIVPQSIIPGMKRWRAKSVKIAYKIVLCFIILSTMVLLWACSEDSGWSAGMYGRPMNSANFGQVNSNGQVVHSDGQAP